MVDYKGNVLIFKLCIELNSLCFFFQELLPKFTKLLESSCANLALAVKVSQHINVRFTFLNLLKMVNMFPKLTWKRFERCSGAL